MTDRPIIMSAPMVRALVAGTKTQTRRIVKGVPMFSAEHDARWRPHAIPPGGAIPDQWSWWDGPSHGPSIYHTARCPFGQPGDRLWVRETWADTAVLTDGDFQRQAIFRADPYERYGNEDEYVDVTAPDMRWCPSIHMPRWASRLTLTVTDVRAQRLQDISEEDARAEGMQEPSLRDLGGDLAQAAWSERQVFSRLWNHLHGRDAWDANPWVWAVSFHVEQCNIDTIRCVAEAA